MRGIPEDILLSLADTEIQSRATACFTRFQAKNIFNKHTLVGVFLLVLFVCLSIFHFVVVVWLGFLLVCLFVWVFLLLWGFSFGLGFSSVCC